MRVWWWLFYASPPGFKEVDPRTEGSLSGEEERANEPVVAVSLLFRWFFFFLLINLKKKKYLLSAEEEDALAVYSQQC